MIFATIESCTDTATKRPEAHFVKRSNSQMFMCGRNKSFMAMKFVFF